MSGGLLRLEQRQTTHFKDFGHGTKPSNWFSFVPGI